jgi:YhcH/YjgK/YiaL family protein
MPEALLRSQFAALETPDASEGDIAVDIAPDVARSWRNRSHYLPSTSTGSSGMIIDTLSAAAKNAFYPPVIRKALQAVAQQDPHTLPPGKYTVDGDNLFFTVVEGQTRPLAEQRPEFHRQYIDIHIVLAGEEIIGAGNKGLPIAPDGPFNEAHDIGFARQSAAKR